MIGKKKDYLFVCDDVEFWSPRIQRVASDYQDNIHPLDFEVCGSDSIESKSFSYFDRFYKIYTLDSKTVNKIKKRFDIDNHKFCIITLNGNPKKKKNLEDILFNLIFQTA